ncbi:MAG: hypothetical protein ACOYXT_14640 [Bacteroidota bacterium]
MKLRFYLLCLLTGATLLTFRAQAQDEGFIYGKVYTEDGKSFEGPIRWGKEEVYWTDLFNAAKERNENLRYLSDREREELDDRQDNEWFTWEGNLGRWFGWNDRNRTDYVHQFSCQFGDIKKISPMGRKYVEIELQNGLRYELSGEGYNDVGSDIRVADTEIGEVDIDWSRIEKVEFMSTPAKLAAKFGEPLYGTVEAFGEKFTGYIQWDHDERLSTDRLDGDSDEGDLSIEFSKIRSIDRKGGRSLVVLKSGRELMMDGSNDVSSGHRGVIVMNKEFAAIDIPWDEFDKIVFEDKAPGPIATYSQFKTQNELRAKVTTHGGKSITGKIVYDLDESHDHELLQGKEGDFEFSTAFRNIKRITTKGSYRCTVELRNGKKINLDDAQDVNERNQGVLVFTNGKSDPAYIPWEEIAEIEFL